MSLDKKILFFARDPGGASQLSGIIHEYSNCEVYAKDFAYNIFINNKIKAINITSLDIIKEKLDSFSLVVTGTSYADDSEKELWKTAKEIGIPTVAYFDHWMNFNRFNHKRFGQIYPDYIFVFDKLVEHGIIESNPDCSSKVLSVGSTVLEKFVTYSLSNEAQIDYKKENGFFDYDLNIVYAAEKIKGFAIEDEYGVNEFSQFEKLIDACLVLGKKIRVFFRPHPKHNVKEVEFFLDYLQNRKNIHIELDKSHDKISLLYACDVVFGINTMVLIEAMLLGKRVCSIGNDIKSVGSMLLLQNEVIYQSRTENELLAFINGIISINKYDKNTFIGTHTRCINSLNDILTIVKD